MAITVKSINEFLTQSYAQIELKRGKHGFFLSGGRSLDLGVETKFYKTLDAIDLEELKSDAKALSLSGDELKTKLQKIQEELTLEKENIKGSLDSNEVVDAEVFNELISEQKAILGYLEKAA